MNIAPRNPDQMRPVSITAFPSNAAGSVLMQQGETRVLCTASISQDCPPWLLDKETGQPTKGWVTAEYNMMPGSTPGRKRRGPDSRGTEIQRLIGRCLRAAVNLKQMPGLAITCDCDVITADGGTRTASITGACVALQLALAHARQTELLAPEATPLIAPVAGVSVGVIDGQVYLDLDYPLDVRAEVDMNVCMTSAGQYVELQGTGEQGVFDRSQLNAMLDLAEQGISQLTQIQKQAVSELSR